MRHLEIKFLTVLSIKSGKLTVENAKGATEVISISATGKTQSFFAVGTKYNFFYEKGKLTDVEKVEDVFSNLIEPTPLVI